MHGRGLEPLRLSAVEPKTVSTDVSGTEHTVLPGDLRCHPDTTGLDGPIPPPSSVRALEAALVRALEAAATAGRFDVVMLLAKELEARRLASVGNVAQIRR